MNKIQHLYELGSAANLNVIVFPLHLLNRRPSSKPAISTDGSEVYLTFLNPANNA